MPEFESLQDKPDKPAESFPDNPWALLAVLAIVAVGVALAALGHWRRAAVVIASALLVAGLLRMVLPRRLAGLLVVRRVSFDAAVYLGLGILMAAAALVVPPGDGTGLFG